MSTDHTKSWRLSVDIGGTFTDCLGLAPDGHLHRAKVLSSSALRGKALEWLDPRTLRVEPYWSASADLIVGFRFRLLPDGPAEARVAHFDLERAIVHLDSSMSTRLDGVAFELLSPDEAPILAARLITGTAAGDLPPIRMRLATTRGTNALLQRNGARVAFFVTRGFGDLLEIGTQQRPDLFALRVGRPPPLHHLAVEVPERMDKNGAVIRALDEEAVAVAARHALDSGAEAAAVALAHAYRNDAHERRVEEILRESGFHHVTRSTAVSSSIGLLQRAATAAVDAYLAPLLDDYLVRVDRTLAGDGPRVRMSGRPLSPGTHSPSAEIAFDPERGAGGAGNSRVTTPKGPADEAGLATPPPPADAVLPHDHSAESASRLHVMTSAGGLVRRAEFRARDSLLSGPAGGVVGAALAGHAAGFDRLISFDMGGTSTDVARYDGDFDYAWSHRVADVELLVPALAIESVAAGGGSICAWTAGALTVGPDSAGASPGPACYGAGGPLTITDCNLLLGRVDPERFGIPLSRADAERALDRLIASMGGVDPRPERLPLLAGLIAIADERMADAIRAVSIRRGYDPADYALVAFGGAGAQHACGVAERLGIRQIIVPGDAGLLSAWGLAGARLERMAERQILRPLEGNENWLRDQLDQLGNTAAAAVRREGLVDSTVDVVRRLVDLRFSGQDSSLTIEYNGISLARDFLDRYAGIFGHLPESRPIEIDAIRVIAAAAPEPPPSDLPVSLSAARPGQPTRMWLAGEWRDVLACDRDTVRPGTTIRGPALILDAHSAVVVLDGWSVVSGAGGALILSADVPAQGLDDASSHRGEHPDIPSRSRSRSTGRTTPEAGSRDTPCVANGEQSHDASHTNHAPEAVREQLFTSRFENIVAEMGEQLRRTALSVNVKERLDFSCALLDPAGELVANAPHIPVHLGALGLCVRTVAAQLEMAAGDVVVTNHPAFGGSHLPDVTTIAPVHDAAGALIGYVANRAHHAEIGGAAPGSMPPAATSLAEEGVVIPPMTLIQTGRARWDRMSAILSAGRFPSRAIDENLADLRAQVAAARRGANLLRALAANHGSATVATQMKRLTGRAEAGIRGALRKLPPGTRKAHEELDDGSVLAVRLEISPDAAHFDFTGTSAAHRGNLNATPAIVHSAVLYVLRLMILDPIPLNEGLLRPVRLTIPDGSLLSPGFDGDPEQAPAVVGGNTEVSQRLVDTILKALGVAACSQGTMNNLLWGNARSGYYETVCGGSGAGPGWDGCSAVHTHMTNTRITDPEVLEYRSGVRVERFAIRRGSGGAGVHRGGDGAIREIRFLEPMTLSVLTQHRRVAPYGMEGGEPGLTGWQHVLRVDGGRVELGSVDGCEVAAGDRLVVETPGGGGWGKP